MCVWFMGDNFVKEYKSTMILCRREKYKIHYLTLLVFLGNVDIVSRYVREGVK